MNDQQQSRADALTDEHIATLKLAARAVTPQDIDGAERIESRPDGSYITCPACEGEGCIPFESDYCNYDHVAIGVQFYGVGTEPGAAEAYFRAAKPATILALLDRLERAESALAAPPVEQPALLTAQDALAAIETFEIVGDNNDSREPNAEDRFILTEFVAHLFGGFRVELPAAAPASANETGAEGATWYDRWQAECTRDHGEYDENAPIADRLRWWVPKSARHGTILLEDDLREAADELSRSPAMAAEAQTDWRELSRRLYVELFHCDQQMRSTRDEDGEPHWTQSTAVRDVLADAKAALDLPIGTLGALFAIQRGFGAQAAMAAVAPADERAALPQIPDLVKATAWLTMCLRTELSRLDDDTHKALDEVEAQLSCVRAITNGAIDYEAMVAARAAASPAAEAVALTDEGIIQLFEEKADVDLEVYHGIAASTVLSFARALLAAPQPAQAASPAAERVTDALQALSADVHTLGDGWANDEAMIGLAKKYLRVEPKPASPELSLWRDFVLLAVTDAAPQPAQADAPAHAAECPHCDGEGVIEGDSGTSPCACQRDAQEGMPTFGARRAQADAPAEARERDDPELIAASNKGYAAGLRDGKALGACGPLAPADAGEAAAWRYRTSGDNWCYCDGDPVHVCDRDYEKQPLYTAPPAARVASLTNSQREAIEFAAKTMEARMLNAHACVLRALLNGADKS